MRHEVPAISTVTLRFFRRIVRSYFRKHFRAVLIQNSDILKQATGPLILYANHGSWWDPMVCVLLAQTLLPSRKHYAPMDAAPLARYPVLRKLGIFPIELATARGAVQFLRTSEAILKEGGVLWVTPQGRFSDTRERPLAFKPGLAALALRVPQATVIPLAIEYTFWNESRAEALAHFGDPIETGRDRSTAEWTAHLEGELARTMDVLAAQSAQRNPALFRPLVRGGAGIGGVYDLWRRLRAWTAGQRFDPSHEGQE